MSAAKSKGYESFLKILGVMEDKVATMSVTVFPKGTAASGYITFVTHKFANDLNEKGDEYTTLMVWSR